MMIQMYNYFNKFDLLILVFVCFRKTILSITKDEKILVFWFIIGNQSDKHWERICIITFWIFYDEIQLMVMLKFLIKLKWLRIKKLNIWVFAYIFVPVNKVPVERYKPIASMHTIQYDSYIRLIIIWDFIKW